MEEDVGTFFIFEYFGLSWIVGAILFCLGLTGIGASTLIGYMMMGSGMLSAGLGFKLNYYAITGTYLLVLLSGCYFVFSSVALSSKGAQMVNGLLFTMAGLVGVSASTIVAYQMQRAGMLSAGYGFNALFYVLTLIFIGITLFGMFVILLSSDMITLPQVSRRFLKKV